MCLICIDFNKGRLAPWEARRNLGEIAFYISPEHVKKVEEMLDEAEKSEDEHDERDR